MLGSSARLCEYTFDKDEFFSRQQAKKDISWPTSSSRIRARTGKRVNHVFLIKAHHAYSSCLHVSIHIPCAGPLDSLLVLISVQHVKPMIYRKFACVDGANHRSNQSSRA